MTELNEYDCELLDALLEAFGVPDSLTRDDVMQLFDGDEAVAFAMIQILIREELIAATGDYGPYDLPQKLILKPKGEKLLKDGGFLRRHQLELAKPPEIGGLLTKVQQQNLRLQNLKLSNEAEITNLIKQVNRLKNLQLLWWFLIFIGVFVGYYLKTLVK